MIHYISFVEGARQILIISLMIYNNNDVGGDDDDDHIDTYTYIYIYTFFYSKKMNCLLRKCS